MAEALAEGRNRLSLLMRGTTLSDGRMRRPVCMRRPVFLLAVLFEVLVTCLQRFAGLLKLRADSCNVAGAAVALAIEEKDGEKELGCLVMECLDVTSSGQRQQCGRLSRVGWCRLRPQPHPVRLLSPL